MTVLATAGGWSDPAGRGYEVRLNTPRADTPRQPAAHQAGIADFGSFYGATVRRVVRHVYALTGNVADAQEIAQEAFARAWQRWDSVSTCDSPEAWVRRVATNLATSRFRRDRTARAAARELIGRDVPGISPDTVALLAGLRKLPARQREVMVLHYLADLPIVQIAAELHCPVGSVKAWLSRGRAALARELGDGQQLEASDD